MHPLFSAAPGALGCLEASGKERNCASSGGTLFVGHGGERRPEGARLYRYFSFFCPLTDPVPGRLFCLLKRLFQGCERARRRSVVAKEFRKSAPQLAHSAAGRRKPERSHRSMRVEAKRSLAGHSFERAAGVGLREAIGKCSRRWAAREEVVKCLVEARSVAGMDEDRCGERLAERLPLAKSDEPGRLKGSQRLRGGDDEPPTTQHPEELVEHAERCAEVTHGARSPTARRRRRVQQTRQTRQAPTRKKQGRRLRFGLRASRFS
jgi:hypothetical protein